MGFVFRKSYTESLFKKWYVTSTYPIYTHTQALPLSHHTAQPCKHSHNVLSTCKVCTINGEPPRLSPLSPPLSKLIRKKISLKNCNVCVRFFILTEFYGQTLCVCRACSPTCISPLIVRAPCDNQPYYIHSSWFLTALIKYVLSQHTGVVELRRSPAGKVGVSPFPIFWRSS